jgi:hypothetical protein
LQKRWASRKLLQLLHYQWLSGKVLQNCWYF